MSRRHAKHAMKFALADGALHIMSEQPSLRVRTILRFQSWSTLPCYLCDQKRQSIVEYAWILQAAGWLFCQCIDILLSLSPLYPLLQGN
eukprot:scaffold28713_cov19-Prasinocladus_malaysianus.AAC.2